MAERHRCEEQEGKDMGLERILRFRNILSTAAESLVNGATHSKKDEWSWSRWLNSVSQTAPQRLVHSFVHAG